MKTDRPTVGFFTCHLDNNYAAEVSKGVIYAAEEADINLVIFPGMFLNASYNDPVNSKYDYQYNSIYYYASQHTLDALIVSIGSIGSFLTVQDKKAFLDHFNLPVLTLEIEVPGYPCLYTESTTGMREVVEHVIKTHHKRHIGFVTGRLENADANERFEVYKNVLRENNIEYREKLVAYGDFSEYTENIVGRLIDRNPDIEAIIFANDQMTIGGYKAIKKRGLEIGKDILVTGFDNSITSLTQSPTLTTVDNNLMDLGYHSVYQALELLHSGKTSINMLKSQFIPRRSCPADPQEETEFIDEVNNTLSNMKSTDLLLSFKKFYLIEYQDIFFADRLFKALESFYSLFTEIVTKERESLTQNEIINSLNELYENPIIKDYFSHTRLTNALSKFHEFLSMLNLDEKIRSNLFHALNISSIQLSYNISRSYFDSMNTYKSGIWTSENITKDTLIFSEQKDLCYNLILDKLNRKGFKSSYIYLYENDPIKLQEDGSWAIPDDVIFKACSKNGEISVFDNSNLISTKDLFHNEHTENDARTTLAITPIYTNDTQHGIFICEATLGDLQKIYSSCLQLGTSLKFMMLVDHQNAIHARLEKTMNEINIKNDMLNTLYITDELTGLYNRRGFFEAAEGIMKNPYTSGHRILVAFIDMNNLKQVNDIFGHNEGDFALKSIADTLKKSFPENTVVARIGGDEFAVFMMDFDEESPETLRRILDKNSAELNETSNKPYFIEFSYGFHDFICKTDSKLDDMLIKADEELYIDKKCKRKSVLRQS